MQESRRADRPLPPIARRPGQKASAAPFSSDPPSGRLARTAGQQVLIDAEAELAPSSSGVITGQGDASQALATESAVREEEALAFEDVLNLDDRFSPVLLGPGRQIGAGQGHPPEHLYARSLAGEDR